MNDLSLTWKLLHTMADKISNEKFIQIKLKIQLFIFYICKNLKCPICKYHSINYLMKNSNIGNNNIDFKDYLFKFHTKVNIIAKKKYYEYSKLIEYKNNDIIEINNKWKKYNEHLNDYCLTFVDLYI